MAASKKTSEDAVKEEKTSDKDAEITALKAQLAQMQTMMMTLMSQMNSTVVAASGPQTVTLIHLIENAPGLTTYIKLTTRELNMSAFGEERTLTISEAEELVGKYRRLFDRGVITFGAGAEELCKRLALKTISDYNELGKDFVERLATINLRDLEDLYNKVDNGHKEFIIGYFKRKIIEGDQRFADPYKVELLNRLSDGAMENTAREVRKMNNK